MPRPGRASAFDTALVLASAGGVSPGGTPPPGSRPVDVRGSGSGDRIALMPEAIPADRTAQTRYAPSAAPISVLATVRETSATSGFRSIRAPTAAPS